jgi:hypothetical protein
MLPNCLRLRRFQLDEVQNDLAVVSMGMGTAGRSRCSLRLWAGALVTAAAIFIIVELYLTAGEGPDLVRTGRLTVLELHRICVQAEPSNPVCVRVERPSDLTSFGVGDCVAVVYSPEEILVRIDPATDC